jgi:hypothetical protein
MPSSTTHPDNHTLRKQHTQAWLSQPQGYIAGARTQIGQTGGCSALAEDLRKLELKVKEAERKEDSGKIALTRVQAHLLEVGAWAGN